MQEKIREFFEKKEEQRSEEANKYIASSITPSIYINGNNNDNYTYELERIYSYCYQHGCENISVYIDNGIDEMDDEYNSYHCLLEAIADGAIETVVFYSVDSIPEDVYELLYNCKISGTKIELVDFDGHIDYQSDMLEVLNYIVDFE